MEQRSDALPFRLADDERLEIAARTEPELLAVTDRRVVVASAQRMALDLPHEAIRRVQLDVEVGRPATLVLVPHEPQHVPAVLMVPHDELEAATRAVYLVANRLRAVSP